MKIKPFLIVIVFLALLIFVALKVSQRAPVPEGNQNNSEQSDITLTWKVFADPNTNASFKYPEDLGATYIHTIDWPPKINIIAEPFSCLTAGVPTERAGRTEQILLGANTYCVTKVVEGAAGSTYTQYAYARAWNDQTLILTFTIQMPQCLNYDDPEKTDCQKEQTGLDLNRLVDKIFGTLKI